MEQKITPDSRLVICKKLPNGSIDHSIIQSLEQWQRGHRNFELIRHGYADELLGILTEDLGLVSVDENGLLRSRILIVNSEEEVRGAIMRILGKIAEAMIVRNCHNDIYANRRWGQIARRGTVLHHTLDQYLAIGTGLESTRLKYFQKYRPNDPQRDVIWIHCRTNRRELQTLIGGRPAGYSAGLQMKVSMNGFQYIYRTDIRRAKYEVPLVYFDLCNDYYQLANAIYLEDRELVVGVDLVRGKDVDPALHDRLCSYWWLVERLVRGQMTIDQLRADELLFDAYKKDLLEDMGSQIITI
ncbi:MAG: hypothetical protein M0R33_07140 [Methylomonas sp.]|uniref:hypothetical protein n=1 Tax=Methylomonas sp. TaxID=418 RepID=UPI0025FEBA30|nr:hypothetical protein [Methylomonas sp.]MCK9606212.1 hypothetical protein [Methylomonas sp.]